MGDEESRALLDGLCAFIDHVVLPLEEKNRDLLEDDRKLYAENGAYAPAVIDLIREVRMRSAEAGYYAMFAPEVIGGGGMGPRLFFDTWERIFHRYGPARLLPFQSVARWTAGPNLLFAHASERVRTEYLPQILSGAITGCFAMSEPDAGSDVWSMSTRAERVDGGWVVNGTKQWTSNSGYAAYALAFACTDDEQRRARKGGISCFFVPADSPGYRLDSVLKLFGHAGGNEGILSFTEVFVPDDFLIGEVDRGLSLALQNVSQGRIYNAGRAVGLARWALEQATEYAKVRKTFGKPIADYQAISFALAESAIDIYAARLMGRDVTARLERGEPALKELAMTKAFATEACFRVYDRCIQVHGGMGLTNEARLYDGWQTARGARIADGTAEMMRRTIASRLLSGDVSF